jgi:hypothetical protein
MMKRGKQVIRSYMTLEYEFTGIRLQEGYLTPVDWILTVNLIASVKKGKSKADAEYKANMAYQKIYFWLDTNLPSIVFVDVNDEDDLYVANLSSNITMYCPGNPGDDMIVQLLHSKLSALAGNELEVGEIHLKGSDTSLQYTFDCPELDYQLPTTTAEYYTEGTVRDEIPWWSRNDGFCFEFIRPADTELSDAELFKDIMDPMNDFDRIVTEMADSQIGIVKEPAKIVQVEKWKPRKVE